MTICDKRGGGARSGEKYKKQVVVSVRGRGRARGVVCVQAAAPGVELY